MTRTRSVLILGLLAVVLTAVFGISSLPARSLQRWEHRPPTIVTYSVVEPCRLVDEHGKDVDRIGIRRSMFIEWINNSMVPVSIFFEPGTFVGRDHIYLTPGESYVTIISAIASEEKPGIHLRCGYPKVAVLSYTPPVVECPPDTTKPCP